MIVWLLIKGSKNLLVNEWEYLALQYFIFLYLIFVSFNTGIPRYRGTVARDPCTSIATIQFETYPPSQKRKASLGPGNLSCFEIPTWFFDIFSALSIKDKWKRKSSLELIGLWNLFIFFRFKDDCAHWT